MFHMRNETINKRNVLKKRKPEVKSTFEKKKERHKKMFGISISK